MQANLLTSRIHTVKVILQIQDYWGKEDIWGRGKGWSIYFLFFKLFSILEINVNENKNKIHHLFYAKHKSHCF